jgi:hypothetical protein
VRGSVQGGVYGSAGCIFADAAGVHTRRLIVRLAAHSTRSFGVGLFRRQCPERWMTWSVRRSRRWRYCENMAAAPFLPLSTSTSTTTAISTRPACNPSACLCTPRDRLYAPECSNFARTAPAPRRDPGEPPARAASVPRALPSAPSPAARSPASTALLHAP